MSSSADLLTVREVAETLRVARSTVSRWSKPGGPLSPIRVGGVLRYRRSDVDALLVPEMDGAA